MELTNWTSASGKTNYWGILFADGYRMQVPSRKQALSHIQYLKGKLNEFTSTSSQSTPVRQQFSGDDTKSNHSVAQSNGDHGTICIANSDVNLESAGATVGDGSDEATQQRIQAALASRKADKKSSFPFPRQLQNLAANIKNGAAYQHQLVREQGQLVREQGQLVRATARIAEFALDLAAGVNGVDVGTIESRVSAGIHKPLGVEQETIEVKAESVDS